MTIVRKAVRQALIDSQGTRAIKDICDLGSMPGIVGWTEHEGERERITIIGGLEKHKKPSPLEYAFNDLMNHIVSAMSIHTSFHLSKQITDLGNRLQKLEEQLEQTKSTEQESPLDRIKRQYSEMLSRARSNPNRDEVLEAAKNIIEVPPDRRELLLELEDDLDDSDDSTIQ